MKNPFESGTRKVIPSVLIYGRFEGKILVLHLRSGKWNGLGGKCELDESPLDAACREFQEESGLTILPERFKSLGVLQFPNFKPQKQEDWIVFVFTVNLLASDLTELLRSESGEGSVVSDEGTLHWVPLQELPSLPLWPGDRYFISYVLEEKPFIGTVWYQDAEVSKYWIQELGPELGLTSLRT